MFVYSLALLSVVLSMTMQIMAFLNIKDSGVYPLEKNSVAIQFYVDVENEDRLYPCQVHTWTKRCCFTDLEHEDCNIMHVYGVNTNVRPKDKETLVNVFPSIHQHDVVGNCDFVLDYQCGRNSGRRKVSIPFDTRIFKHKRKPHDLMNNYVSYQKADDCETLDQESLDNCAPVNCDLKYLGERPFYDDDLNICVKAPVCEGDPDKELPDIAYLPNINSCRDLDHPLTLQDIYTISAGLGTATHVTKVDNNMRIEMKSNCSTISQNLKLLRDMMYGKLCPTPTGIVTDYSKYCKTTIISIIAYVFGICGILVSFVCCIHITSWLFKKILDGSLKDIWNSSKKKFRKPTESKKVDFNIKNTLLREVIIRDIPIELRESVVDICDRIEKEVKWKKRYRVRDVGSQVSLTRERKQTKTSSSNMSSEDNDKR